MTPQRSNALTVEWAKKLNQHGILTVPMAVDDKYPLVYTSQYFGKGFPLSAYEDLRPQNIAALPGLASRLVVLDLDGPQELICAWFKSRPALPRTWQVTSGGGGRHLWFRLPSWWTRPVPNVQLWKGTGKHEEILVLGDRKLASCPPSRYGSGKMYKWAGSSNPLNSDCGYAPRWLLDEIYEAARPKVSRQVGVRPMTTREFAPSDEIQDRLKILVDFGLRLAGRENASGWIPCHRPGDTGDRRPSASARADGSVVWTSDKGSMDFWSVLVALKAFPTTQDAIEALRGI